MRFQVDEQREELKKRIDDIALAMIDEIKKKEAIYFKELKERISSLDESKSLEKELKQIEELFDIQ
jgi:predicted methyltransferase